MITPIGDAAFRLDYVHVFEGTEKVFVFIVHRNEAAFIEDDRNLYPSDALIAKFRLIQEGFR